ncbi:MAG: hypothetical protein HDR05_14740 [Lachnospiraceae bacterium]|nr:hypothetical protein [Lachnospiraceae bacterium]
MDISIPALEKVKQNLQEEYPESTIEIFESDIDCDFLVPQETPEGYVNSYYSLGVRYLGEEKLGVSWQDFRKEYVEMGGDGYYGAWSVPYLEPVISERVFAKRLPSVYENIRYEEGLCPVAEKVQRQIMQIKTNYRDLELATKKADILCQLIRKYQ